MAKNEFARRLQNRDRVNRMATEQTIMQYCFDTMIITLRDPAVMGKDTFGYARILRLKEAWQENYKRYGDAMSTKPEADYVRVKLDDELRKVCGADLVPFEMRYQWAPEVRYDRKE